MGEIIKLWLEIIVTAGTVFSVAWKFILHPVQQRIKKLCTLLIQVPVMLEALAAGTLKIEAQGRILEDIRKKIYPNGGTSLDDKLSKISEILYYQQESNRVAWKVSSDAICRADARGNCIFVNFAWLTMSGFSSPEEAYGTGWIRAIHPDDRNAVRQEWEEAVRAESILQTSFRMRNVQTSKEYPLNISCSIIRTEKGEVREFFAILTPRYET